MLVLASALSLRTTWVTPFRNWSGASTTAPGRAARGTGWSGSTDSLDAVRRHEHPGAAWLTTVTVPGDADVDVLLGIGQPRIPQADVLAALIESRLRPTAYPELS